MNRTRYQRRVMPFISEATAERYIRRYGGKRTERRHNAEMLLAADHLPIAFVGDFQLTMGFMIQGTIKETFENSKKPQWST